MPTSSRETVPRPARPIPKPYLISQASGDIFTTILATIGLGNIQEAENQLYLAAETYRRVLQLAGDPPLPIVCEAHLGLARISTNGTTWMPPSSTGNRASNWRGSMTSD